MKNARYWFLLGNMDEWANGSYCPPITLPREFEAAFDRGFAAGQNGRYYKRAWKKHGVSF